MPRLRNTLLAVSRAQRRAPVMKPTLCLSGGGRAVAVAAEPVLLQRAGALEHLLHQVMTSSYYHVIT